MTDRQRFEELVARRDRLREDAIAFGKAAQEDFNAAVVARALVGRKGPMTTEKAFRVLGADVVAQVRRPFEVMIDEAHDAERVARHQINRELRTLAASLPVARGASRILLDTVCVSTYRSQTAAESYARGAAENVADVARDSGIDVEIVVVRDAGKEVSRFDVFVCVESKTDIELLRVKPGAALREQVRRCWARGVNPRVYNPFLPHGFEEREEIDFQGRDLRAARAERDSRCSKQ